MLYGGEVTTNCIEPLASDVIKRRLSECEIRDASAICMNRYYRKLGQHKRTESEKLVSNNVQNPERN